MALWTITSKKTRPQEEVESQEVKEKRGWLRITLAITLLALAVYGILQVLGVLSPTPANAPTEAGAAPPVVQVTAPPVVEPEPVPIVVETTTTEVVTTTTTAPSETTTTTEAVVYVDGAPGSCLVLEEKHCFLGEGFVTGYDSKAIGFNLPEGTPLFFPWEEGTFLITKNSSSPGDPWFSSVTLLDSQSDFMFLLVGFAPYDELGKLEEDRKILGMGDAEGDTLNLAMKIGEVEGTSLEGFGDGGYTLVVLVGDSQADYASIEYYEQLFGVTEFSN